MIRTSFVVSWPVPSLRGQPEAVRLAYWRAAVPLILKQKDKELAAGLNRHGRKLPRVRRDTARRRRSAMTPNGKGDPKAPYLMPGRKLSRTRSLLAAKELSDGRGVRVWWRYDAYTGREWGEVLRRHAMRGPEYDVIGLSPQGTKAVRRAVERRWAKANKALPAPVATPTQALPIPRPGRTDLRHADFGIGSRAEEVKQAIVEGRSSGFLSPDEWAKYWRSGRTTGTLAKPARTAPAVRSGASNVILKHVWEVASPNPGTGFYTKVARGVNKIFSWFGI